jgi:hypothetical protein
MPQPFLYFGAIGVVIQDISGGCGAKRMCTDLEIQAECIPGYNLIDSIRGDGGIEVARAIVGDGPEEGTVGVGGVPRLVEIVIKERLGAGRRGDVPSLAPLAMHP